LKVSDRTLASMTSDMNAMVAALSPERLEALRRRLEDPAKRVQALWEIWFAVCDDHRHDDAHPRFTQLGQERVLPFDFDFPLYPDDTNDKTLTTALKAVVLKIPA
jgi:hypothetical protein